MSIQWPEKRAISDRKYHEAGVRGRFENNLRIVRGRINTTSPTIIQGVGFTVVRNGVGDVTITFDPPFSGVPSVITVAERPAGAGFTTHIAAPTVSTARIVRDDSSPTREDGIFHFIAIGPA